MMSNEFKELAYERAIIQYLRRMLTDKVPSLLSQKDSIICEDVPYVDRLVPFDAVERVINKLSTDELDLETQMKLFNHRRENVKPRREDSKEDRPKATGGKRKRRRSTSNGSAKPAESGGGG